MGMANILDFCFCLVEFNLFPPASYKWNLQGSSLHILSLFKVQNDQVTLLNPLKDRSD